MKTGDLMKNKEIAKKPRKVPLFMKIGNTLLIRGWTRCCNGVYSATIPNTPPVTKVEKEKTAH